MEEKKVSPIIICDAETGAEKYILEFSRASVRFAEARGFRIDDPNSGTSITWILDLFYYSFRMHHPTMTPQQTERILVDELGGMPEGMAERLGELYAVPFNTLVQDEDQPKNARMTVKL